MSEKTMVIIEVELAEDLRRTLDELIEDLKVRRHTDKPYGSYLEAKTAHRMKQWVDTRHKLGLAMDKRVTISEEPDEVIEVDFEDE